jgi:hypothetical protein
MERRLRLLHAGVTLTNTAGVGAAIVMIPSHTEAVAVEGLLDLARGVALLDDRIRGIIEELAHADGGTEVGEEAAHGGGLYHKGR